MIRLIAGTSLLAIGLLAGTANAQQSQALDEPTVKKMLEDEGYSNIQIERSFDVKAEKDGKDVSMRIDAEKGLMRDQKSGQLTEASVRNLLEEEGYSDVSNLKKDGDKFKATATKGNEEQALVIDAESGDIESSK